MNAFQLRLELLKMSKDMLEQEYFGKREISHNNWQVASENARTKGESLPNQPEGPKYPTESEVIAKAATLNNFVSNITVDKPTTTKKST